jgi:hypothetical protein
MDSDLIRRELFVSVRGNSHILSGHQSLHLFKCLTHGETFSYSATYKRAREEGLVLANKTVEMIFAVVESELCCVVLLGTNRPANACAKPLKNTKNNAAGIAFRKDVVSDGRQNPTATVNVIPRIQLVRSVYS